MTGPQIDTPVLNRREGVQPDGTTPSTPHPDYGWDMGKVEWSKVRAQALEVWGQVEINEDNLRLTPEQLEQRLDQLKKIYDLCVCYNIDEATRRRLLDSLAENNFQALDAITRMRLSTDLLGQGNDEKLKRELVTQTVLWMLRDEHGVATEVVQGRGPHCYAGCVLPQMNPSEMAKVVSDLSVDGTASIVRDGRVVTVLRYDHGTYRDQFEPDASDGRRAYNGSVGISLMRAISAWDVPAWMQQNGAAPAEWLSLWAHVSNREVVGVNNSANAGRVYLDANGRVTTADRAVRSLSPYEFFSASASTRGTKIIAQIEWGRDGIHLHHVVEVTRVEERYSAVTGRVERCYLIRNPLGPPLGEDGRELPAGRVVRSGRMAYEVAPGNNGFAYVPETVMSANLKYFGVAAPDPSQIIRGGAGRLVFANDIGVPDYSIAARDTDFKESDQPLIVAGRGNEMSPVMRQFLTHGTPVVSTDTSGDSGDDETPRRARATSALDRDPFRKKSAYELALEASLALETAPREERKEETLSRPSSVFVSSADVNAALNGNDHMVPDYYGPAGSGKLDRPTVPSGRDTAIKSGISYRGGFKIVDPSNKA